MRKTRVKQLWKDLIKIIPNPNKQQWRKWKSNYNKGLF